MKKVAVLAVLLMLAAMGFLAWRTPGFVAGLLQDRPPSTVAQRPAQTTPPAQPVPPSVSQAAPPMEQFGESADAATGLERVIPRQSVAREEGLHKTRDPLRLGSSAALVMDTSTREVLYGKNDQAVLPMASLTKLMTGLLIVQAKLPMDELITITQDDVDTERSSRSRLRVGATLTRGEALKLALMSSENRAAHALGRTYPGGMDVFVKAMNDKARELGMMNTVYVDPTGLSASNRSSARDLAMLTAITSRYALLREYSTAREHQTVLGARRLRYINSNNLVRNGWDISLQKTGYIIEAGHCVALRTAVAGRDVVMVLLDAGNNRDRTVDAQRLRRWLGGGPSAEEVAAKPARKERKAAAKPQRKDTKVAAKAKKGDSKATATAKTRQAQAGKPVARKSNRDARDRKLAADRQASKS